MNNRVPSENIKPNRTKKDKRILRGFIIANVIIAVIILIVGVTFHFYFKINANNSYMDLDISDTPSYVAGYDGLLRLGANSTIFLATAFWIISTWIFTAFGIIISTDIIWIIYGLYYLIEYFIRKNSLKKA